MEKIFNREKNDTVLFSISLIHEKQINLLYTNGRENDDKKSLY